MTDSRWRPQKPADIPTQPGVYVFWGERGEPVYIGKAQNLKARLSTYFHENVEDRVSRMLADAESVTWTICDTPTSALILEAELIRRHQPRHNVRLRWGDGYPQIYITNNHTHPRIGVTRGRWPEEAERYGPYPQSGKLGRVVDVLSDTFGVRQCTDREYNRAKTTNTPCLLYQIGRCSAPCVGAVSDEEYADAVGNVRQVLGGDNAETTERLKAEMAAAAEAQNYEWAAVLRDRISGLEAIAAQQQIVAGESGDFDVVAWTQDSHVTAISVLVVREGRVIAHHQQHTELTGTTQLTDTPRQTDTAQQTDTTQLVEAAKTEGGLGDQILARLYAPDRFEVPSLICLLEPVADETVNWLRQRRGRRVEVRQPKRGTKAHLLQMAAANAEDHLRRLQQRRAADPKTRDATLSALAGALGMGRSPLRIEAYDISHLGGTNTVASMVVFEDGLAKKKHYRSFNIDLGAEGDPSRAVIDDYASIRQVISRRLCHIEGSGSERDESLRRVPDLILIDGGRGQLSAALESAVKRGWAERIHFIGLAKEHEEIWLPKKSKPLRLDQNSDALLLLRRIRDEAHRFALTTSRRQRRRTLQTSLLDIDGVGETRARKLLQRFGSVAQLATVDEAAIAEIVGDRLAKAVKIHAETQMRAGTSH